MMARIEHDDQSFNADRDESVEQTDDTSGDEADAEHEPKHGLRVRLATQEDLDRIYGSGNLLIGRPVKPEPLDEDAS